MYRALRKALQRELEPVIFDRYVGRGLSPDQALDDYMRSHLPEIAKDLTMLLHRDRAQRAGRGI